MTKIKNFRITLRGREIARTLKNHDHLQLTPDLEALIEHTSREAKDYLTPAAVYTTLTRDVAEKATSIALPKSAIAVSVIAVTLGAVIEEQIETAKSHGDALQISLMLALRQEGLSQSMTFANKLLLEQAKEDECEMSELRPVAEPPLLPALTALLGVERIGLHIDAEDPKLPAHARLVWSAWTPIPKRSRKRSEATPRAEKAAV